MPGAAEALALHLSAIWGEQVFVLGTYRVSKYVWLLRVPNGREYTRRQRNRKRRRA